VIRGSRLFVAARTMRSYPQIADRYHWIAAMVLVALGSLAFAAFCLWHGAWRPGVAALVIAAGALALIYVAPMFDRRRQ
jgi:multisubunit Na+/H+ antiporter MnhB subunit